MNDENQPKVRFKGFTDPWEQRKLIDIKDSGDRYSFTGGPFGSDLKSENYEKKGVRIIQLQNIGDGHFLNNYKIYTSEEKAKELASDLIYPGEIIIAKMADPLARATIIPNFDSKYLMASDGIRLRIDTNKNDTYFILSSINNAGFRNNAMSHSTGTTRRRIGLQMLGSLTLGIPKKEEQTAVGNFVNNFDNLIAANQDKLDQLKEVKKLLMQKIFDQQWRFSGFTDPWEQRKLIQVLKVNSGRDYKHLQIGDVPVYGTGGYMLSVSESLSNRDAIGIGRKGTINAPQFLRAPFWTVDTLFYMIPEKNFDLSFVYSLCETINWKKYDESTGVPSLSKKTIESIKVSIPMQNEQEKIGDLFSGMDYLIAANQDKVDQLKEMKKWLMQNMFV